MEIQPIIVNITVEQEQLEKIQAAEYLQFGNEIFVNKKRAAKLLEEWVNQKAQNEQSNCNIQQVSNSTLPDLNNFAVSNFDNIAEIAQRLTSGNVAHQSKAIEGLAKNNAEFIRKYYY